MPYYISKIRTLAIMKLRLILKIFLFIFLIAIPGIYLFIPSPIRVSKEQKIKGFDENIFALLSNSKLKLWTHKDSISDGYTFNVTGSAYPRIFIEAVNADKKVKIEIEIISNDKIDSCKLYWHYQLPAGHTPWARVQNYLQARKLKEIFAKKMDIIDEYAGKTENTYGISIVESKVKDTLIATLSRYELKPASTSLICIMINNLRQQISNSNLLITDSAMAILPHTTEGKYKVMVGFPVNKAPESNSNIAIKKMIPGKLLTATIYGGPAAVNKGYLQMKEYIIDRGTEEAALPYEVFVTNRCLEKDTAKWITKICYPVF